MLVMNVKEERKFWREIVSLSSRCSIVPTSKASKSTGPHRSPHDFQASRSTSEDQCGKERAKQNDDDLVLARSWIVGSNSVVKGCYWDVIAVSYILVDQSPAAFFCTQVSYPSKRPALKLAK